MTRLRVLVVEDSFLILMALETTLEKLGIEIVGSAGNLRQAVALAQTTEADFAILDVNLVDEMVFPAAEILKARHIPFLFTTGYSTAPRLQRDFADAPQLMKPYDEAALMQQIAVCLADAPRKSSKASDEPEPALVRDTAADVV